MAESRPPYGSTLKRRDGALDLNLNLLSPPLTPMPQDTTPRRKSGPRSIGVGKRFSVISADLTPSVYDRTARNPFSPLELEETWYPDVQAKQTFSKRSLVEPEVELDTTDNRLAGEVEFGPLPNRVLTVPWLPAPARRDGRASRRSLTGLNNPNMEIANKGGLPNHSGSMPSVDHTPNATPTAHSMETTASLGTSIALSVIFGLAAIGLTTWAGLSYRRKKRQHASKQAGKRAREDDEESFTCNGPEEGDDLDAEKGLKSPLPSPGVLEGTPRPSKGFRLWSPLPLFSPSSPSRSVPTTSPAMPAPTRRAVLDNPIRGPGHGLTISTSETSIASTKSQSLLDALDSPIPLSLSPIAEESNSMRSHSSIDELHRRLSIASIASDADSMRRNSSSSTYSSCSDRSSSSVTSAASSSDHEVAASDEEMYAPERSFSFSSETPSVLIETPRRVDTPTLTPRADARNAEAISGLSLPTAPSAASIHEALDDMIGLFCHPPDVDHTRPRSPSLESEQPISPTKAATPTPIPHLAEVAAAIGKVAFAKDGYLPSSSTNFIPGSPAPMETIDRPTNPLLKTAAFAIRPAKPFLPPMSDHPFIRSSRPSTPVRRHSLPIALLSRRVEKSAPLPMPRYSEMYGKDHLQRGLLGLRARQNSLPTVSESEAMAPSDCVRAAYQFTANMDKERVRLETRRKQLFFPAAAVEVVATRAVEMEKELEPTPEREALARFLTSVSETEDDEESEESFSPYTGTEWEDDDECSRWLVYEENFPLPESGLPQIMVTCH